MSEIEYRLTAKKKNGEYKALLLQGRIRSDVFDT